MKITKLVYIVVSLVMKDRQLLLKINNLEKEIQELLVIIDTLQTNLRTAVSYLDDKAKEQVTGVQSYKWCSEWRRGDS